MANKNQKRIRTQLRKASKAGNSELAIEVPAGGYHNGDKGVFVNRRIPTARADSNGVNSSSPERNMRQVVFKNEGGGEGSSITRHVPIHNWKPVTFKNHSYLIRDEHGSNNYRQDAGALATA